jgi:hypothetical protein
MDVNAPNTARNMISDLPCNFFGSDPANIPIQAAAKIW